MLAPSSLPFLKVTNVERVYLFPRRTLPPHPLLRRSARFAVAVTDISHNLLVHVKTAAENSNSAESKASRYVAGMRAFAFTLSSLLPYLQFLDAGCQGSMRSDPDLNKALKQLEVLTEGLGQLFRLPCPEEVERMVLDTLGVPCAIFQSRVIPLSRLLPGDTSQQTISWEGICYELAHERARPLQEILDRLDAGLQSLMAPISPAVHQAAIDFLDAIGRALGMCRPADRGSYLEVYTDGRHTLHHYQSQFYLVRRPADGGCRRFVGLLIQGRTRQQMLATPPGLNASGLPPFSPVCMGPREQYAHYLTDRFTDAEAVVQYLDAAVGVAGRSAISRARMRFPRRRLP
jgi:hypothetical protein